jgi:hypothetical protein
MDRLCFFWAFWYIICIFLILFELVMNFPSFSNFLEFELKGLILVVPSLSPPTEAERWDQSRHQQPHGADRVKIVDRPWTSSPAYCPRRWRCSRGPGVKLVCVLGSEGDGEPSGGGVVTYWSPEQLRRHGRATNGGGLRRAG